MIAFSADQPSDQEDSDVNEIISGILEALRAQEVLATIGPDVDEVQRLYDEADAAGCAEGDTVALDDYIDDLFHDDAADDEPDWDRIIDLSHLDRVVYFFPGGASDGGDIEIVLEEPIRLYAAEGDPNKYIEDAEGTGFIIGPKGTVTELHPKVGESVFE